MKKKQKKANFKPDNVLANKSGQIHLNIATVLLTILTTERNDLLAKKSSLDGAHS